MRANLVSLFAIFACVLTMGAITGCAAESGEDVATTGEQALRNCPDGICDPPEDPPPPPPPPPTTDWKALGKAAQKRAGAVLKYALGGPTDPTAGMTSTAAVNLRNEMNVFRGLLAASLTNPSHSCDGFGVRVWDIPYPKDAPHTTIKGAVTYINCQGITAAEANAIMAISPDIEAVWPGARSFWHITCFTLTDSGGGTYHTGFMEVDPEPATLGGALSGSGATAAATYVNSATTTTAYYWPSTWTPGSAPVGLPCSAYVAASGATIISSIQAVGGYRKCL